MKKNIVFVLPNLGAGGGEKSLINVLNTIDYSLYNVDLIVFHKSGLFLQSVPQQVTLLEIPGYYQIFKLGLFKASLLFLKQFQFQLFYNRLQFALTNILVKNKAVAEQNNWKYIASAIPQFTKKYDAAIGFLEKSSIYLVTDKISATTKIGWIHTNYSSSGMNVNFDAVKFSKLKYIVTVSIECQADLIANFPFFQSKIKLIHNIVSPVLINEMASKTVGIESFTATNLLVTVARLSPEKGIDLALEAAKILKEKQVDFQWVIIGDGVERENVTTKIATYNLKGTFILLGLKQNPYPFIAKATVYVQPSRYEGKSLAIDEAKILLKPIIVTNYPSAKDQIKTSVNGLIAQINAVAISDAILELLKNDTLRKQFSINLKKEDLSTTTEIDKLYTLINEA